MSKKKKKKVEEQLTTLQPHEIFPNDYNEDEPPHKTVMEAINYTERNVARSQQATKERRNWVYIQSDQPVEWVKEFFNKPQETPVRVGENHRGKRMVAVWNGVGNEPDSDPDF